MPKKLYTLLRNRLYTISRIGLGTLLRNIHLFLRWSDDDRKMASMYESFSNPVFKKYITTADAQLDSSKIYQNMANDIKKSFVPELIGWKITHSFRAKNSFGALVLNHYEFFLDKEMTKVLYSNDLSDEF